jgi:hypothetical protein
VFRRSREDGKTGSFSFTSSRLPVFLFILLSPAAWGCSTHQCDPSTHTEPGGTGTVTMSDGTWIWESSPIDHGWITFDGNATLVFVLPSHFPSDYTLQAWVSTGSDQTEAGGGQFVEAAGQLAEFQLTPNGFSVFNDTCASYYLRVVATATGQAPVDAGADAPHD